MVSKVFEKLVNKKIVDHLEKCDLFSDFQFGFRSSRSTVDLLKTVSNGIARGFNKSEATPAVAIDISKAFDQVFHVLLLYKLKSYGILDQKFGLIFSFLSNRWDKNIQVIQQFLKASLLVLHFSCYTLMTFLTMLSVILLSTLMTLPFTLSVIRHLICGNNLN